MTARTQQQRIATSNSPPGALLPGQLYVEMGTPFRLWGGVPANIDATGRKLLVDATNAGPWVSSSGGAMTGLLTLSGAPVNPGHAATKAYTDGLAASTAPGMDGIAVVGVGTTWARSDHIHPTDTSRYAAANPAGYQTAAQVATATAAYLPLTGGPLSGAMSAPAIAVCGTGPQLSLNNVAGTVSFGAVYWNPGDGYIRLYHQASNGWAGIDGGGNFIISGVPFSPAGGAWNAVSDARVKTVEGEYTVGLAEVLRLRPISYVYKGNDTPSGELVDPRSPEAKADAAPYPASPHYQVATAGRRFVGFVAQELEAVMPGMVTTGPGWIDGVAVTDLRKIDPSELVYALVNSIKELSARLDAMEAVG